MDCGFLIGQQTLLFLIFFLKNLNHTKLIIVAKLNIVL